MSLSEAVSSGDRMQGLVALRDRLAADIDDCTSMRDLASLSQRLMDVLAQIESIGRAGASEVKGTPLDELKKRRAAREANPAGVAGAEG